MVGVPSRSKGCNTCRRRKKGCDKKVPHCGQCLASGIQCEGYRRQAIWLNSEGSQQTAYSKSVAKDAPRTSPETLSDAQTLPTPVLHDSLAITARTQNYTGRFWSDYLSGGNGFSLKASGTTKTQWIRLYDELCRTEATLNYVTMALSTATLGANNNDNQLKTKGLQAYGLAMQQLANSIRSKGSYNDGVLAAIQLMCVFEITASISRRSRSPFSQTEWKKSQLWNSIAESPLNRLLNTMVEIPGLLEDLDAFRKAPNAQEAKQLHSSLIKNCQACELALLAWEVEMGETLTAYDYTKAGEPVPLPQTDDDLAVLYLSHMYWMICLLLYSVMGSCEMEAPHIETQGPSTCSSSQQIATSYAYRIAHSIHMLFQPPAGDYSALAALFPLGNALRYLIMLETSGGQNLISEERLMLVEIFTRPFLGSFVGRFLRNLQSEDGIYYGSESIAGMRGIEYRARVWWCGIAGAGLPDLTPEKLCF
ncbi:hypothetical protein FZEAL_720 [Fusarium zealandicum]|uniref:Zn(2)-C6 fungal-type domain-containing protein n=1 Tax=Fusarium zealandicum TaxID=1053134 RepID=A0A8H4UUG2_9HYPO|nr:hypothetical protein FZEAL_720 [Fusarium zealandicum]